MRRLGPWLRRGDRARWFCRRYAKKVERAREEFKVGNLFETVLSQVCGPILRKLLIHAALCGTQF